jgi:hypothetical protein
VLISYKCLGPLDPRLMMLIQDDEMAQAAFHVSEALKFALTHYRYSIHGRKGNKLSGAG